MPNLNDITTIINDALKADNFSTSRFQNSRFFGIADRVKITGEETERYDVGVIDNDGEVTSVCYDDTYNLSVYHRVLDIEYQDIAENDYGIPGHTMTEFANMKMIIFGNRAKLKVRPENIIAGAIVDFPKELSIAQITALNLNSCVIEMSRAEVDPYSIWDSEFQGSKYEYDTNTILVSIPYKITSTFNKGCFTICQS